jgi:hypothetical protein
MSKCAAPLQQIFKAARKGLNCEWLYQVVHVLIQVSWLEVLVAEIHRHIISRFDAAQHRC